MIIHVDGREIEIDLSDATASDLFATLATIRADQPWTAAADDPEADESMVGADADDDPESFTLPTNVEYLYEHGPSPAGELPTGSIQVRDRVCDVRKFLIRTNEQSNTGGRISPVYYIAEVHDPRDAAVAFLEANPGVGERSFPALVALLHRDPALSKEMANEVATYWKAADADGGAADGGPTVG